MLKINQCYYLCNYYNVVQTMQLKWSRQKLAQLESALLEVQEEKVMGKTSMILCYG